MSQSSGSSKARKQTLIEDETQFQGVLVSECPIVVKGKVDGEVSGPSLQVSDSGAVSGKVKVQALDSQGSLSGTIEAEEVNLSGKVEDKTVLRARSLDVKLASEDKGIEVTFGECDLEVGDVPRKEDAVHSALAPETSDDTPAEAPAEAKDAGAEPAKQTDAKDAGAEPPKQTDAKDAGAEPPKQTDAKDAGGDAKASGDETDDGEGKKGRSRRPSTSPTPA